MAGLLPSLAFLASVGAFAAVFLAALVGMEGVAWASHKYLMHGPLWILHRSHHRPPGPARPGFPGRSGRKGWEANDWFGVFFSLPAIGLVAAGTLGRPLLLAAGLGMTAYGLAYLLFHDGLVHGRFGRWPVPGSTWLARLVTAHRLHHARRERLGCRSFGFLFPPLRRSPPRAPAAGPIR
jgi:beta-carotene 3-hydroxylase